MSAGPSALHDWLASRHPPVPEAFLSRLGEGEQGVITEGSTAWMLAPLAHALQGALAREGERGGAFRLLAADAWITWASEQALAGPDPEGGLLTVLHEVLRAAEGR